jgi:hypothetical protein
MKQPLALLLLVLVSLAGGTPAVAGGQEKKARPFSMGVGLFPYDFTPEAIEATQSWIAENTDIVAMKLDEGVPWQEALENKNTYDPKFEESLAMKAKAAKEKKVFVSVTPLNKDKNGMANYRGPEENMPNPEPWNKKDLDDPVVLKAFLNYCRELIRRYKPDYFAYAIEVNNLAKLPAKWKKFVPFAQSVYVALKKEHPQLQVFVTLGCEATVFEPDAAPAQKKAIKEILVFSDLVAVTALPYVKEQNPAKIPKDYFSQMAALGPGKPFAIAETAFLAEDVNFFGIERVGKPAWQADYLKFCFEEGVKLNAKFVIWMLPRDPDMLYDKLPPLVRDILLIIKDTGLLDGQGNPRKSYEVWSQWLKYTRTR